MLAKIVQAVLAAVVVVLVVVVLVAAAVVVVVVAAALAVLVAVERGGLEAPHTTNSEYSVGLMFIFYEIIQGHHPPTSTHTTHFRFIMCLTSSCAPRLGTAAMGPESGGTPATGPDSTAGAPNGAAATGPFIGEAATGPPSGVGALRGLAGG